MSGKNALLLSLRPALLALSRLIDFTALDLSQKAEKHGLLTLAETFLLNLILSGFLSWVSKRPGPACVPLLPVGSQSLTALLVTGLLGRWVQIWVLQSCRPEFGSSDKKGREKSRRLTQQFRHRNSGCFCSLPAKVNLVNKAVSSYKKQSGNSSQALSRILHDGGLRWQTQLRNVFILNLHLGSFWPTSSHFLHEILTHFWARASAYFTLGPTNDVVGLVKAQV